MPRRACRVDRSMWGRNDQNKSISSWVIYYYIGINVLKKLLNIFDGKKDLIFDNKENLSSLKKYLKKRYPDFSSLVILFDATKIYSYHLKSFCVDNNIKAYVINP